MEPTILSTIIWGVLWLFVGGFVGVAIFWGTAAIGAILAKGEPGGVLIGGVVGWTLAAAWEIFVIIQVVLHVVTLIQLLFA